MVEGPTESKFPYFGVSTLVLDDRISDDRYYHLTRPSEKWSSVLQTRIHKGPFVLCSFYEWTLIPLSHNVWKRESNTRIVYPRKRQLDTSVNNFYITTYGTDRKRRDVTLTELLMVDWTSLH